MPTSSDILHFCSIAEPGESDGISEVVNHTFYGRVFTRTEIFSHLFRVQEKRENYPHGVKGLCTNVSCLWTTYHADTLAE